MLKNFRAAVVEILDSVKTAPADLWAVATKKEKALICSSLVMCGLTIGVYAAGIDQKFRLGLALDVTTLISLAFADDAAQNAAKRADSQRRIRRWRDHGLN